MKSCDQTLVPWFHPGLFLLTTALPHLAHALLQS